MCKIWEFNPQELANAAWTFATLAVRESELLEAVRPAAVCKIWEFKPQDLVNSAWAFATLAVRDSELLEVELLIRRGLLRNALETTRRHKCPGLEEMATDSWDMHTFSLVQLQISLSVYRY